MQPLLLMMKMMMRTCSRSMMGIEIVQLVPAATAVLSKRSALLWINRLDSSWESNNSTTWWKDLAARSAEARLKLQS